MFTERIDMLNKNTYSIVFRVLKWHCYHVKEAMNTAFPVYILYHSNLVTICFIVITVRNESNTRCEYTRCHYR